MISESPQPKPQDWFGEFLQQSEIKHKSVRGIAVSAGGQLANQLIGFASLVILARLLTPEDFGIVAMIGALIGIAGIFQDLGLSGSTVRATKITAPQISNLFWANSIAGAAMMLVIMLVAPLLQDFYNDPRIQSATCVMAIGFLLGGLSTQHQALLRRCMCFSDLALISICTAAATAAIAITGALLQYGFWSLIMGSLTGAMLRLYLSWRICDWKPGLPRLGVGTRPLAVFGVHLALFGVLGFLAKNLHSVLIGRTWGAIETGIFTSADAMKNIFVESIKVPFSYVAPAALSRLKTSPDDYCRYYYDACSLVVIAAVPVVFVCFTMPADLVHVLLGEQWSAAAPILKILAVGMLPQIVSTTSGWIFLSAGNSRLMMQWGVLGWGAIIAGTLIGFQYGVQGIAIAFSVTSILLVIPSQMFAIHGTPIRLSTLLWKLANPIAAGFISGAICTPLLIFLKFESEFLKLLVIGVAFTSIFTLLIFTTFGHRPLLLNTLRALRPG